MRLHVSNFPFDVTGDDLRALFSEFGIVEDAFIIRDKNTRVSRGFGFVDMQNVDEALAVIECLGDYEWRGRRLLVSEARERVER
jgi:RNA recognition motif-containing protein